MTPDAHEGPADVFWSAVEERLTQGGAHLPSLLAEAYALALAVSSPPPDLGALPGDTGWIEELPVAERDVESLANALCTIQNERSLGSLIESLFEVERLASTDDSGYAGMTSSGGAGFYAFQFRKVVYWFHDHPDADNYCAVNAYDVGDASGRRQFLRKLAEDWLHIGDLDVSLSEAFDAELRKEMRLSAEARYSAPWQNDLLADDLRGIDPRSIAAALDLTEAEVARILDELAEDLEPRSEVAKLVAWNVSWPLLELRE